MENFNFGKPIKNHNEEELLKIVDHKSPNFGQIAMDELNRRELKDFKEVIKKEIDSNKKLSNAFLAFAVIQVFIAFIEIIFNTISSKGPLVALGLEILIALVIIFIFRASGLFKKES